MTEVYIEPYSDKSFTVWSQDPNDTISIKDNLKELNGKWNSSLRRWIFSNKQQETVADFLADQFGKDFVMIEKAPEELVVVAPREPRTTAATATTATSRRQTASPAVTPAATASRRQTASAGVGGGHTTTTPQAARPRVTSLTGGGTKRAEPVAKKVIYNDDQGDMSGTVIEQVDPDTIIAEFDGERVTLKRVWQLQDAAVFPHTINFS